MVLAVLLLLLAPVVGRLTQQLGYGKLVRQQLCFSRSGQRPPAKINVTKPGHVASPVPPPAPAAPHEWVVRSAEDREGIAFSFVPSSDALRGPPPVHTLL